MRGDAVTPRCVEGVSSERRRAGIAGSRAPSPPHQILRAICCDSQDPELEGAAWRRPTAGSGKQVEVVVGGLRGEAGRGLRGMGGGGGGADGLSSAGGGGRR
jgi:hypothetical protein